MLNTDELEDVYAAVLGKLESTVGKTKMRKWGYINLKDWVRVHIEQGETEPTKIARLIIEESENE